VALGSCGGAPANEPAQKTSPKHKAACAATILKNFTHVPPSKLSFKYAPNLARFQAKQIRRKIRCDSLIELSLCCTSVKPTNSRPTEKIVGVLLGEMQGLGRESGSRESRALKIIHAVETGDEPATPVPWKRTIKGVLASPLSSLCGFSKAFGLFASSSDFGSLPKLVLQIGHAPA
jgi:hypothetical protein